MAYFTKLYCFKMNKQIQKQMENIPKYNKTYVTNMTFVQR